MTDKKYTDEEIKKALECCGSNHHTDEKYECKNCPLNGRSFDEGSCYDEVLHDLALDLINRYEAEIERLQKANERFEKEFDSYYARAKSQAIKEFADRLNAHFSDMENQPPANIKIVRINEVKNLMDWILHDITRKAIDEVVKEMTEEQQ